MACLLGLIFISLASADTPPRQLEHLDRDIGACPEFIQSSRPLPLRAVTSALGYAADADRDSDQLAANGYGQGFTYSNTDEDRREGQARACLSAKNSAYYSLWNQCNDANHDWGQTRGAGHLVDYRIYEPACQCTVTPRTGSEMLTECRVEAQGGCRRFDGAAAGMKSALFGTSMTPGTSTRGAIGNTESEGCASAYQLAHGWIGSQCRQRLGIYRPFPRTQAGDTDFESVLIETKNFGCECVQRSTESGQPFYCYAYAGASCKLALDAEDPEPWPSDAATQAPLVAQDPTVPTDPIVIQAPIVRELPDPEPPHRRKHPSE